MPLDSKQARAATTYGASLAVIAGAGSGKTQTMKDRVADAFADRTTDELLEGGGVLRAHGQVVGSIGEVLAITFTEAAAAELKDRVKSTLRDSADPDVRAQALLVDDAWISTIHGMCSRLLRENAFALGVDPLFSIVTDTQRDVLLSRAIEEALSMSAEGAALVLEYGSGGQYGAGVHDMVSDLIGAAVKSPKLFDSFVLPPQGDPAAILRYLRTALANDPKEDVKALKASGAQGPFSTAGMLSEGDSAALVEIERLLGQGDVSVEEALDVCRLFRLKGGAPADPSRTPAFDAWDGLWADAGALNRRSAISLCVLSLVLTYTNGKLADLVGVARDAYERFQHSKQKLGALDNDDLLLYAYAALQDERIQALYRDKFKLVIVDEFQDTNQLQLDIIRNFTGEDDSRLCVVGDRMQSIYRFQGADVSVCNGHLDSSAREVLSIDNNYRSHERILRFVDTVFGEMGCEYLPLVAARDENRVAQIRQPFDEAAEGARVQVLEVQQPSSGYISKDARQLAAQQIATRFKRMHEAAPHGGAGRPYGQMVILLSAMTNAHVYAQALRDEGIPCAVVKGSVMKKAPEATMIVELLNALSDASDTQALFAVLEGLLFELSDKDLADLALPEQGHVSRNLARRFNRYVALRQAGKDGCDALAGLSDRAACAVRVIGEARSMLGRTSVASVVNYVVAASGLLDRLQGSDARSAAEGQAIAGNVLKMVRLVREMEEQGASGPSALAVLLAAHIHETGETPGGLAAGSGDFVRIMTIHASKGLAFPVVAMSELQGFDMEQKLFIESCRGATYLALDLGESAVDDDSCAGMGMRKLAAGLVETDGGFDQNAFEAYAAHAEDLGAAGIMYAAARAFHAAAEEAELQRKIYVGMTRAEEALIVVAVNKVPADQIKACLEDGVLANAVAESGLDAKDAKRYINVNGLDGSLVGSIGEIHRKRLRIVEEGGDYCVVTPMWLGAWSRTGVLPPCLRGQAGSAEDGDGFDLRTIDSCLEENPPGATDVNAGEEVGFVVHPDAAPKRLWHYRFASAWSDGVISASSIKAEGAACIQEAQEPSAEVFADEGELVEEMPPKVDSVARGLAFHAACEWAANHWAVGGELAKPPADRIRAICRFNGLTENDVADVDRMLDAWLATDVAKRMAACKHLVAEAPFFLKLNGNGNGEDPCVNGFIDLLAYDGDRPSGRALVVDYKTGISLDTPEARRGAYEVQAQVYAYALLQQGFDAVELRFVFVEQGDGALPVEAFPAEGEAYTSAIDLAAVLSSRLEGMALAGS